MTIRDAVQIIRHERDDLAIQRGFDYSGVTALGVAITALEWIGKAKDFAEFHVENVRSDDKYFQQAYQLGQRHIIDIIDKMIEEVGGNDRK